MRAHEHCAQRTRIRALLLALVALIAVGATPAMALLSSDYQFSTTNATYTPLGAPTTVIAGTNTTVVGGGQFNDTASAGPFNIGFSFQFDCLAYTQFGVSTSGTLFLGSLKAGTPNNDLAAAPRYPIIAPWWDHQHLYNNGGAANGCSFTPLAGIHYALSGTAPNRVLTVEFNTQVADIANSFWWAGCGLTMNRYQVRLYEGTNKIEFHYGSLWASSGQATAATIGIANGTTNFLSVTPSGGTATVSSVTSNNAIAQHVALIPAGTVYAFTPCYIRRIGNAPLATPSMAPGDSLLVGQNVKLGDETSNAAFSLNFPAGSCPSHNYTMTISGPAATDYRFLSTGNQTDAGAIVAGGTVNSTIIFRPSAIGARQAFLTVTDNTIGCSVIFTIAGTGTARFQITGNPAQGGTPAMTNLDTLLKGKFGIRGSTANFQPFTTSNTSTMNLSSMNVTYTITGGSGQYTIIPNATLGSGQSNTPTIAFTPLPSSLGPQSAQLTVAADGQSRTYVLYAAAAFPELNVFTGSTRIDSSSLLYVNTYSCSGEQYVTYPLDLSNPNFVADTIWGVSVYQLDTVFRQGAPRYPFARSSGNLVLSKDYRFSPTPGAAPINANAPATFPIVIQPGQTVRYYLTFVAQRPNRRFARLIMRTNAYNQVSPDTSGLNTIGVLRVDLFGRGVGGHLAGTSNGGPVQPITFPVTPIGETRDTTFQLWNTGQCDLRISLARFEITSGDVNEFSIVSPPNGTRTDPATGDLLLAPGTSTSITVRFKPVQIDSRRASIRVRTNDSTSEIAGVVERGVYYVDLYGTGKQDLYPEGADLGTALIGGDASEHTHGVVRLRNTQNGPVLITQIKLVGVDSLEFNADPLKPWPVKYPYVIQGGQILQLGIEFAPRTGGLPGPRTAAVRFTTVNGDTIYAPLTGVAGTRTIEVTPLSLTFGPLSVGKQSRQSVKIKNTGTMPMKIKGVSTPPADFAVSALARMDLIPGQEEVLEFTYEPSGAGTSNGTVDITSNATNGTQQISVNGTAVRTRGRFDDPSIAVRGNGGPVGNGIEAFSAAGVSGVRDANGMALMQSVPNPAHDVVEIGFVLPVRSQMQLGLYDAQGRLVRVLQSGVHDRGEGSVRVDVSGLASGVYHYRLTAGGSVLDRTLTVVK